MSIGELKRMLEDIEQMPECGPDVTVKITGVDDNFYDGDEIGGARFVIQHTRKGNEAKIFIISGEME